MALPPDDSAADGARWGTLYDPETSALGSGCTAWVGTLSSLDAQGLFQKHVITTKTSLNGEKKVFWCSNAPNKNAFFFSFSLDTKEHFGIDLRAE